MALQRQNFRTRLLLVDNGVCAPVCRDSALKVRNRLQLRLDDDIHIPSPTAD